MRKLLIITTAVIAMYGGMVFMSYRTESSIPIAAVVGEVKKPVTPRTHDYETVMRVVDGDTIQLENGEKVRYIGIDTPETVDPRKPVQCFGKEAAAMNRELVEGKEVRLEKDINDKDRYGRLLRYVWVGNIFINLKLVKEGYATAYTYPPDVKHSKEFVEAERVARTEKLGLWSACR